PGEGEAMKTKYRLLIFGGVLALAGFISVLRARPAMSDAAKIRLPFVANNVLARALAMERPDVAGPLSAGAETMAAPTKQFPVAPVSGGVMRALFDALGASGESTSLHSLRTGATGHDDDDDHGGQTGAPVP